jgi:hypothetical protein
MADMGCLVVFVPASLLYATILFMQNELSLWLPTEYFVAIRDPQTDDRLKVFISYVTSSVVALS